MFYVQIIMSEHTDSALSDVCVHVWRVYSEYLSPVLSKGPIILLHGLDLRVLVSIFLFFHCGSPER